MRASRLFLFVLTILASAGVFAQTLTTLANFGISSTAPAGPAGKLIRATDGNFYGTTDGGGTTQSAGANPAYGTIYKMTPGGNLSILYSFCTDISATTCVVGLSPSGLIQASDGNLYGTTAYGGANGLGTVFKVTLQGVFTILHSFCASCNEGSHPATPLTQGSDGNLYGTTSSGSDGAGGTNPYGSVFKITLDGTLTTLYTFCPAGNCAGGQVPSTALVQASDGDFYGATVFGGADNSFPNGELGAGTIFRVTPAGKFTLLHQFCANANCADGTGPNSIVVSRDGAIYGTTGGALYDSSGNVIGSGTAFRVTTTGVLTTLHTFCAQSACLDGAYPRGGLLSASDGNLYGTAIAGGANNTSRGAGGTVFKMTPEGVVSTVHAFCAKPGGNYYCLDGFFPSDGLVQGVGGAVYGTTLYGGSGVDGGDYGAGTVFSLSLPAAPPPVVGTTTTLSASPTTAPYGTAISLTTLVKASEGTTTPTGTVKFEEGSTLLGTVTLNSTGQGTLSTKLLPVGSDSVVAIYSGSTGFDASTSNTVKVTIAGAPVATLSSSRATFPATEVGATSVAQVITLKNTGSSSLAIGSLAITGLNPTSFIELSNCGKSLSINTSCSIIVGFAPTKSGALTAKLNVTDNAAGSPQSVTLVGSGLATPSLTFSSSSVSFPATQVGGASLDQAVTVTNRGSTSVSIYSTGIVGTNAADFAEVNTCGATLGATASCTIYVGFTPKIKGTLTASVSIADSAGGSPQAIKLIGTGN